MRYSALLLFFACSLPACTGEQPTTATRRIAGDTTIVEYPGGASLKNARTTLTVFGASDSSESLFGDIGAAAEGHDGRAYVFDRSAPALLVFDTAGAFLGQWGRPGQGPGEYSAGVTALVVAANGDVLLHDPGARRLIAFDRQGTAAMHLHMPSGVFIERSLSVDGDGHFRIRALIGPQQPPLRWPWPIGQLVVSVRGDVLDSVTAPQLLDAPEGSPGPFDPRKVWDMKGSVSVVARSDVYAVHVLRHDKSVTRIVRGMRGPPVRPEEATWARAHGGSGLVGEVPAEKPVLRDVMLGEDSTVWVIRSAHVPANDIGQLAEFDRIPEAVLLDAYTIDGTALGTVSLPHAGRVLTANRRVLYLQRERADGRVVVERYHLLWSR